MEGTDYAVFDLPDGLQLENTDTQDLMFSGEKVGEVTFAGNQATVVFTTLLDDPGVFDVWASFEAYMSYNDSGEAGEPGDYSIYILTKEYIITIPEPAVIINGEKDGEVDLSDRKINWSIRVSAEYENNGGDADLGGYTVTDDLSGVGLLEAGSLKMGSQADGSDAVSISYTEEGSLWSYTFPEETVGTRYLFYTTDIADSIFDEAGSKSNKQYCYCRSR